MNGNEIADAAQVSLPQDLGIGLVPLDVVGAAVIRTGCTPALRAS